MKITFKMANSNKITVPLPKNYGTLAHFSVVYQNDDVGVVAINNGKWGLRQAVELIIVDEYWSS